MFEVEVVVVSGDVGDGDSSAIGDDDFVFTTPTSFNNEVGGVVTIGDEDFSLPVAVAVAVGEDVFPFFPFGEDDGGLVFLVDDAFPLVPLLGFVEGDEEGDKEEEVFDAVVFSMTDSLNVIFFCAFFVGGAGFFFVGDAALFFGVDGFLPEDGEGGGEL